MKSKKIFLKIIIGIVAGIILNILPMYLIQYKLELPLFMDTLGSITVAFIFGGVPAIICATISQIIMFFVEHYASAIILIYVTTVYAAIGVVCLFRKSLQETDSVLNTIFIIFFISILMALCVSISGGIVNAICIYVQDITGYAIQDNAATSYFQVDLLKMGLSSIPTYILSRIPSNLIERPIITVISFGISVMYQKLQKSE
ncbi:MAG: hypothetical protein MR739_02735 [Spirochaetia bacterium]|nr:hypothetical protein [Spirochaetia bacterium]MDD7610897.1 hypothetical protein [Spirochaetales bacterium]MDY5914458.1 hypothetical protein [Treponema sp.]